MKSTFAVLALVYGIDAARLNTQNVDATVAVPATDEDAVVVDKDATIAAAITQSKRDSKKYKKLRKHHNRRHHGWG